MRATITSKGQITLPKAVRDRLNLKAGDKLDFLLDDNGNLQVFPVTAQVTELKGMVPKPTGRISLEEMDNAIKSGASKS